MNNNTYQLGGIIYGKGAKGSVKDIFKKDSEKSYQYFAANINDVRLGYYNSGLYSSDIKPLKPELTNFLIKTFNKQEDLLREVLVSNDLNAKNITQEFIEKDSIKYNLLYNTTTRNYGLLKEKCQQTLDKYNLTKTPTSISLRIVMEQLLNHVMLLQQNKYTHCDIKADNIMICNDIAKLIDWDKAIYMDNPTKANVCEANYFGSSTHTSDIIYELYKQICKNEKFKEGIKQTVAEVVSHRRISSLDKVIDDETKIYILTECEKGNYSILLHCHIDLYALSLVIIEICDKYDIISDTLFHFIKILQNTISIKENIFEYRINKKNNNINLSTLLSYTEGYYLEPKQQKGGYKQKYLKYKYKYLQLKKLVAA